MALIIAFVNKSKLAEVSDYDVKVYINEFLLWQGELKGHCRANGWEMLVKQFAAQLEKGEKKK